MTVQGDTFMILCNEEQGREGGGGREEGRRRKDLTVLLEQYSELHPPSLSLFTSGLHPFVLPPLSLLAVRGRLWQGVKGQQQDVETVF